MENLDPEQEAVNKRVMEKKWCLVADLPGYKEWSDKYRDRLLALIKEFAGRHILVHPDEFSHSLDEKFEELLKGYVEEMADYGIHIDLEDHENR